MYQSRPVRSTVSIQIEHVLEREKQIAKESLASGNKVRISRLTSISVSPTGITNVLVICRTTALYARASAVESVDSFTAAQVPGTAPESDRYPAREFAVLGTLIKDTVISLLSLALARCWSQMHAHLCLLFQVASIEFSLVEKSILLGLQQGNSVLKEIHKEMSVELVEKLMGETDDAVAYQKVSFFHTSCLVRIGSDPH